jgi:tetratricopeptide (TPR) repeat protein
MNRPLVVAVLLGTVLLSAYRPFAGDPFTLNDYALQLMEKGEHDKALEQFQKAFSLYPYEPVLRKNLAEAYTYVGQRQMRQNNYEAAAASFDLARELFPDTQRYYVLRGIALYYCNYADAARNELERARGLGTDTADILFYLAKIQYDAGNLPQALEHLEQALALQADYAPAKEMIGKVRREVSLGREMDKGYSSRFMVSYDAAVRSTLATEVLDALEEAYNSVGRDLSFFPKGRIPVILYTRKDFRTVTSGPDWSGGVYDGKIRIPLGGVETMSPQLKSLLFHEYSHAVVQELTHGNCPTWLNEGLAELAGRSIFNHPLVELKQAYLQGGMLPFTRLEGAFTGMDTKSAAVAYQQSYSLVRFMTTAYGWPTVSAVLTNLGTGLTTSVSLARALADFGLDFDGVVEEWRRSLAREYGG